MTRLASEGIVKTDLSPAFLAKTLMQIWFGLSLQARYSDDEQAGRQTVAIFLAQTHRLLGLDSDTTLKVGQAIPEEVGDVYARFLRVAGTLSS